ncbi:MAG: hypothetical protein AB1726_16205 [Planctomycetota bacterium]
MFADAELSDRERGGGGNRRLRARFSRPPRARGPVGWVGITLATTTGLSALVAAQGTTTLASVDSAGIQASNWSREAAVSADGGSVAFSSFAPNLVPGDTNWKVDIFVHDQRTGATTRVSVDSAGIQGNEDSGEASISAGGRFAAFRSLAFNLVPGDTNWRWDVFVHDRQSGQTTRVSVSSEGAQGDEDGDEPVISADGRFVAFSSKATNLVAGDTNARRDVFVHDRQSGETTRVSVSSEGTAGNGDSYSPSISADGRCVAFESGASNLVGGDTNARWDVFVHDLKPGETTRVSVGLWGAEGDGYSGYPAISSDGRCVTFGSGSTNFVAGDTNGWWDVFVHDRQRRATVRVSVDSTGDEGNGTSGPSAISSDGRYVVFQSIASNLVPGDMNVAHDIFVHDRPLASATPRNVGTNPSSYTATALPVLGSLYMARVDLAGTTGHELAWLAGYSTPITLLLGGGQTLLVNIADPNGELFHLPFRPGPIAAYGMQVPADVALAGFSVATQALHIGGVQPWALSNALDLVLGY